MVTSIFFEIGLVMIIAMLVTAVVRMFKQPLIIGYICSGIVAGPYLLNILSSHDVIEGLANVGITLLLFIVGLGLNPKMIKDVGKVSILTGVGQVLITAIIGYFIGIALGFPNITAIYIAVALTFSSTIIIMKLLSDKGDLDNLYGRIAIGFLIVQDLIVAIALIFISSISKGGGILLFSKSIGIIVLMIGCILLFSHFVLSKLMKYIAKSQEFLLLFALAWCFAICALFSIFEFPIEIGALLAGISLASVPYKIEISSKLKPLRDFFLILFFISLGAQVSFGDLGNYVNAIIVFSLFVLIGNPLIMMILMRFLGYKKKTGFKVGLTVAQISEFSLILIALGISVGHIPPEILSLVTVIGLITIVGSSYMILYSNKLYSKFSKYLKIFEKKGRKVDDHRYCTNCEHEIILFGYNRIGSDILGSLKKMKKKVLVVDFNPETVLELAKSGYDTMYGDAGDIELLNEINFSKVKMVISTISDSDADILLLNQVYEHNKKAISIVVSQQIDEAIEMYNNGATYVILPHFIGGNFTSTMIERYGLDSTLFLQERLEHLKYLNGKIVQKKNKMKKTKVRTKNSPKKKKISKKVVKRKVKVVSNKTKSIKDKK